MNKTILITALSGIMALPVIAHTTKTASADVVIRAGAKVRIGGKARVRLRAPRIRRYRPHVRVRPRVRYRLRVGGPYYYYGYRYATPPPPRCNYECAPTTRRYYAPARGHVAVVAPAPRPKRFGIGLFAGGMNVEDREATSDIGLLARFRLTPGLTLEGEIGKSELEDGSRIDRRVGASLIYDFSPRSRLSPHILVGAGAVRADIEADDSVQANQAYGEIGVGLGWRLSRSLEIAADIRAGSRETANEDVVLRSVGEAAPIQEDESYTRGRVSAILYF